MTLRTEQFAVCAFAAAIENDTAPETHVTFAGCPYARLGVHVYLRVVSPERTMTLLAHFWHEKVLSIKAKRVATEKLVHSMVRTGPIRESPTVGLDVVHIAGSRQHVTATPSLATIPVEVPISGRAPPPWTLRGCT